MRLAPSLLLPVFMAIAAGAQVREGSIRGVVLTDDGHPVGDAHVYAGVMHGSRILTVLNANTNDFGVFAFPRLAFGKCRVSAEKPESGYLSTAPDIFSSRPALTVVLTPDKTTVTKVIRFGPKAATITGWVRDSLTGDPIAAHLSLAPANGDGWSTTGTDGQDPFHLMIPANTPVNFGACAEGYEVWRYGNSSSPPRTIPLRLRPGATLKVDIKLERSENAKAPCFSSTY